MDITKYHGQFKGTAQYYTKGRPDYPSVLFEHLKDRFNLDGTGRLLDLGCGTGQLAIPMAKYFKEVIAMDPEPEMIEQAQSQTSYNGTESIAWVLGSSETLNPDLGMFKVVAMGRSFNWMDRDATLKRLYRMIVPKGGIAVIAERDWVWNTKYEWQLAVQYVVKRHLVEIQRGRPKEVHEDVIARSEFKDMEIFTHNYQRAWTPEKVIGYLYSTSYCRPSMLGGEQAEFEEDIRKSLVEIQERCGIHEFIEDVSLAAITAMKK
jgi:ubiquinone/menaquinone biosynthesis C-methylase UbiE